MSPNEVGAMSTKLKCFIEAAKFILVLVHCELLYSFFPFSLSILFNFSTLYIPLKQKTHQRLIIHQTFFFSFLY